MAVRLQLHIAAFDAERDFPLDSESLGFVIGISRDAERVEPRKKHSGGRMADVRA